MKRILSVFAVLLVAASLANTGISAEPMLTFEKGFELVENMRQWEKAESKDPNIDFYAAGRYVAFVTGVHDAMGACDSLKSLDKICTPQGATVRQLVAVVSKYLKDNPSKWDQPAVVLVMNALRQAFPCKK